MFKQFTCARAKRVLSKGVFYPVLALYPPGIDRIRAFFGKKGLVFMARKGADKKRILLVDDEQPIRNILKVVLGQSNHVIVEARNGIEALALFKQGEFDLVITDLDMPEMPGDQLVMEIKDLAPSQLIILMTAHRGGLLGVEQLLDVILDKPFPLDTLRAAVTTLLAP